MKEHLQATVTVLSLVNPMVCGATSVFGPFMTRQIRVLVVRFDFVG
jgi:hypothetical protein